LVKICTVTTKKQQLTETLKSHYQSEKKKNGGEVERTFRTQLKERSERCMIHGFL